MSGPRHTRVAVALWTTLALGLLLISGRCFLWQMTAPMSLGALSTELEGAPSRWRPIAELAFGLAQIAFACWLTLASALGLTRRRQALPVLRVTYTVGLFDAASATAAAAWTGASIVGNALNDSSDGLTVWVFSAWTMLRIAFFVPLMVFHAWVLFTLLRQEHLHAFFSPSDAPRSTPMYLVVAGMLLASCTAVLAALGLVLVTHSFP